MNCPPICGKISVGGEKRTRQYSPLFTAQVHFRKQAILRGAIASLYVHWEGFVKTGCRAYLEFVTIVSSATANCQFRCSDSG